MKNFHLFPLLLAFAFCHAAGAPPSGFWQKARAARQKSAAAITSYWQTRVSRKRSHEHQSYPIDRSLASFPEEAAPVMGASRPARENYPRPYNLEGINSYRDDLMTPELLEYARHRRKKHRARSASSQTTSAVLGASAALGAQSFIQAIGGNSQDDYLTPINDESSDMEDTRSNNF
jgi:hypothetical protein